MRDEGCWAELEEAFFTAGDNGRRSLVPRHASAPEHEIDPEFEDESPSAVARLRAQVAVSLSRWLSAGLRPAVDRSGRWLRWHGRLLHFRLSIAISTGFGHAFRMATGRVPFRVKPRRTLAFHPLRAARRPWLTRVSVAILVGSAFNYSAAAVLAATGVL